VALRPGAKINTFVMDRHLVIFVIADTGGGNGEALRRIFGRFSEPRGLLFDRDDVVAAIPDSALLASPIVIEGWSFFDRVPGGADIHLWCACCTTGPMRIANAFRSLPRGDGKQRTSPHQ
jgi:hypothetical protein